MLVVGLTGGMGAGKSTVARLLAEHGAHVVDADAIARSVVEPGTPALAAIAHEFADDDVIDADGALDRAAMAGVVFGDAERLRALEAITHPAIRAGISDRLTEHATAEQQDADPRIVVLDHPLLVESGLATDLEVVVVVSAPMELRIERLVEGRGVDADDARARMRSQATDDERRAVATHVLTNDGDESDLAAQVGELWRQLAAMAAA